MDTVSRTAGASRATPVDAGAGGSEGLAPATNAGNQAAARAPSATPGVGRPKPGRTPADSDTYSAEDLAIVAGADESLVNELKQYGLINVHTVVAGTPYFDEAALAVTRAAVGFSRHGVEARHLRAWRNSADREAGVIEQVITPLLRQRNPQARQQAADTVEDLSRLGGELRDALLQRALKDIR
jgi:hypothetical protein